jgi:hypothetical protein
MEKELFDWQSWDGEPECMQFNYCTLKQQIGNYVIGSMIAHITVSYETGKMEFFDGNVEKPFATFKLGLVVL